VSGESTRQERPAAPEALDRAFGARATCNRCGRAAADYRVIARFLHDLASVRAYCPSCYAAALEGRHDARGDGMLIGWAEFAARFGAPGPPPPPATAVDRRLAALLGRADLRMLDPATECLARRRGPPPHRFEIELAPAGTPARATFELDAQGVVMAVSGDDDAVAAVRGA
jgi:hypothetical protein